MDARTSVLQDAQPTAGWRPERCDRVALVLQGGGALAGVLLGAAIGPGTLLVIFLLGPAVDLVASWVPFLDIRASGQDEPALC